MRAAPTQDGGLAIPRCGRGALGCEDRERARGSLMKLFRKQIAGVSSVLLLIGVGKI